MPFNVAYCKNSHMKVELFGNARNHHNNGTFFINPVEIKLSGLMRKISSKVSGKDLFPFLFINIDNFKKLEVCAIKVSRIKF